MQLERNSLLEQNEELRRERASLQQRLDVFYQAMELDGAEAPAEAAPAASGSTGGSDEPTAAKGPGTAEAGTKAKLGERVEKLHSQLVLESVALRGEVARLKKKKWVLRTILANGGESEQRAIDDEVAQLHAANLERCRQTPPSKVVLDL
mmetsp:Transcript_1159/g.3858  ORF Transcript_1159/g.3858 Transcript_1159/m.3858 type:complete len:150 (+) Transcript_1159:3-452(+)